jgi:Ca2+-binding RTX toxin-like protein
VLCLACGAFAALAASHGTEAASGAGSSCLGMKATIVSGAARIVGTKAPDAIVVKGGGAHSVAGLGGNDRICGGPGNDAIDGGKGVDRIDGGAGDDRILGFKGPDRLNGGPGEDFIDGQQGSDALDGGGGDDRMLGNKGNEGVDGGPGDDEVDGGPGDDDLVDGGTGTDVVTGGAGTDHVEGGPGDGDVVRGDSGPDALSGGPGVQDVVSYASATRRGVSVSLGANLAKGDGHDSLQGFEDVVGSPQGDMIVGDTGLNRLDGSIGDDTLISGGGGEALGGPGSDTCTGFAVQSSCGPEAAPPANTASVSVSRSLEGSSLVVQGTPEADQLRIAGGVDGWAVSGGGRMFAGEGCANPPGNGTAVTCSAAAEVGLIVITGGSGDDAIAIDPGVPPSVEVRANGNGGSDTLEGGEGPDVLEAGENYKGPDDGNDTLSGNGGTDVLFADPGADQLRGGPGTDLLVSSVTTCQGHTFDGGPGVDTVSYARSNRGVSVSLGGTGGPPGCADADRLLSAESLEGSDSADVLAGDNARNSLLGHLGADVLIGKGGKDFLDAADGHRDKRVDCGAGDDELVSDGADPAPISC